MPNPLKAALAADQMQIGMWLGLRSRTVAEIAAGAGFDWCLIDGEHGPYDVSAIEAQLQAMNGQGAQAVVRVPVAAEWMIKQVLDLGAQSLLVPMIDSAEAAARMVRAVRYPPGGLRGMGASVVRASGYDADPGYAAHANDNICLIVQAESRAALDNIDAIAATEGVDCVFIGPADLSTDMGLPADDPKVLAAIDHMIASIRSAGKAVGIITFDPAQMARYASLGVRFIGVGSDIFQMAASMRALAADSRKATAAR